MRFLVNFALEINRHHPNAVSGDTSSMVKFTQLAKRRESADENSLREYGGKQFMVRLDC